MTLPLPSVFQCLTTLSFSKEIFPNIQPKPSLTQLEVMKLHVYLCQLFLPHLLNFSHIEINHSCALMRLFLNMNQLCPPGFYVSVTLSNLSILHGAYYSHDSLHHLQHFDFRP